MHIANHLDIAIATHSMQFAFLLPHTFMPKNVQIPYKLLINLQVTCYLWTEGEFVMHRVCQTIYLNLK